MDFLMATKKRPTMLRLPPEMYEKIRYLAYLGHKSVNMQIEIALSKYIADFENQNGEIPISEILKGE